MHDMKGFTTPGRSGSRVATESHRSAAAPRGSDRSAGLSPYGGESPALFFGPGEDTEAADLIEKGLMEEGAGLDFDEDFEWEW